MAKPKWAEGHNLEACGLYYQGFVSNSYEEVLTQHRLCTVTSYGIRRSRTTAASKLRQVLRNYLFLSIAYNLCTPN